MDFSKLDRGTAPLDFLQFAQFCDVLSEGQSMPNVRDFSLNDVPWLFGRLYQIDVLNAGRDYRFETFGIFWQAIYGEDLTGKKLSDIEAAYDNLNVLRRQFDSIVALRAPVACIGKLVWPGQEMIVYDRLLIPFTADGSTVSRIICAAHYDENVEDMVFYRGEGLPHLVVEDYPKPLAKAS